MSRSARVFLAVATGVLAWVAFPTVGIWPLGFIALVPLFLAIEDASPRDAALLAWLSGALMNLLGASFLVSTLETRAGFGPLSSIALLVALSVYQGLRLGIVGLLSSRARLYGWSFRFTFVLAFAGIEVAFPMILPWTYGTTIHRIAPLAAVAGVGGATLVSVVLVATNVAVHSILSKRARGGLWVGVPLAALAYGIGRIEAIDDAISTAPPLDVGIVQPNAAPSAVDAPVDFFVDSATTLAKHGAELVVSSETLLPGVYPEEDLDGAVVASVTSRVHVASIFGLNVRRTAWDGKKTYFNTALLTRADGHIEARYDKHRLLPFGEYIPVAPDALRSLSPQSGAYESGAIAPRGGEARVRPALSICYEDAFPDLVRSLAERARSNLLVNVTNDGWFEGGREPRVHLEIARARAIEEGQFLVHATNTGVSAVIDPAGRTIAELPEAERTTGIARVRLLDGDTLYRSVGDGPMWGALAAVFTLGFVRHPRRTKDGVSPSAPS